MREPYRIKIKNKPHFSVPMSLSLKSEVMERLRAYAKANGVTRASAARKLIEIGLKVEKM